MNLFLLFLVFNYSVGFPSDGSAPKRSKTEHSENDGPEKTTTQTQSSSSNTPSRSTSLDTQQSTLDCYFSKIRKSDLEQTERDSFTKVSTTCEGKLEKWKSLVGTFDGRLDGAYNEMDLMAARGAAEYHDFDNPAVYEEIGERRVCEQHLKELIVGWDTYRAITHIRKEPHAEKRQYKCGMPAVVSPHPKRTNPKVNRHILTRDEAKRVLNDYHVHVHVGTPLCEAHKQTVSVAQCVNLLEKPVSIDAPVSKRLRSAVAKYHEDSQTCSPDEVMDVDDPEDNATEIPFDASVDTKDVCHTKFFEWTDVLGIGNVVARKPFSQLSRRSKRRKAVVTKQIISAALELLAPGNSEDLRELILDLDGNQWATVRSKLFEELMENIVQEHSRLSSRKERRSLLSLITSTLPYSTILKYFPGITRYEYTKSRQYSLLLNRSPYVSVKKEKYVKEHVVSFIDFITSPLIRTDLPYGRQTLKKSDGSKMEIFDSLRNVRAIEIVEMFIKMKTENNEESELMSRSTLFKILDKCKATKREALECVDYFISDALSSFETLSKILKRLRSMGYIKEQAEKELDLRLQQSKNYLQTDFKLHLKFESKISDHCIKFALSDPNELKYASSCQIGKSIHDHKQIMCERCQAIRDVFDELLNIVTELLKTAKQKTLHKTDSDNIKSESELTVFLEDVKTAETNVIELKKHLARNKHSNDIRQDIIDGLQSDEAFLTMDWSQKVIPMQSLEPQSDFYGKSGISVHVTNVLNIDKEGNLRQHNFVHITNHESQDAITVLLILEHLLRELKKAGIARVHLRSDNAGCYHSTKLITSLPNVTKNTGVDILSFTFSEAQGGKGAADRAASEFKRKLRNWLASGNNAETPEQLLSALTEGRFPKAMSSYLCTIDYSTVKEGKSDIKGIQNLYDFRFDMKNSKMTARKFGKIGEGLVHDTKKFVAGTGEITVEKSGGYHNTDQDTFWKSSKCTKKCSEEDIEMQEKAEEVNPFEETDVNVEESVPTPIETAVFECPEEGCTALFTKYGNLERHLALGKHNIVPEKETLLDFAMNRYAENIEGLRQTPIPSSLKDALTEIPPGTLPFSNLQGWALPVKKTNKKYNKDVVQFVKEKFEEAAKKKLKFYPKIIATEIREQRKDGKLQFPPDTWLNYKQIQNLYHTLGRKSRDLSAKKKETDGTSTQIPATLPSSIRTPANRATAAAHDSKSSSNKKELRKRPIRETTDELIELVLQDLNSREFDDSEDVYDENSEENEDYNNLMIEIEKQKKEIFEN